MDLTFFGTPDFAVRIIEKILLSNHKIKAVVTAPDKERGRGRKITFTPVKEFALRNNLPLLQPISLKDPVFIKNLEDTESDVFVIVAFRILPKSVYSIPSKGSFNLHGSLLPKFRGAAPIQWALINGENETGVTTFFLQDKVDTGNIIDSKSIQIFPEDDFGKLHDKLALLGAELVIETLNKIENGSYKIKPQNDFFATPAPKITKDICLINWNNSAEGIKNLIRGLSPYPGAYFEKEGKNYKVYKSYVNYSVSAYPGEFVKKQEKLFVGTSENTLEIIEIQPEGKKRMLAQDFLRGYRIWDREIS